MKRFGILALILPLIAGSSASAQSNLERTIELQQRILFIIAQTVAQICYTVEQTGHNSGVLISRETAGELNRGITKIASLDVQDKAQYTSIEYQGPLQQELGAVLDRTQNCKQDVFNKLIERLMPITSTAPVATARSKGVSGDASLVQDFYLALRRADGVTASSLVIPEKRDTGPFSAGEIAAFYSSLSEPLQLLGLEAIDDHSYQATYTYRAGRAHVCAGSAIVTVVERGSRPYIEKIKALQGC